MSSTREKILETILSRQRVTINDLAEQVGINPISVRHHIGKLEAESLVASDDERHGVGRPLRYYRLTEFGLESFPTRYMALTTRLLDNIKNTMPEGTVAALFTQLGTEMAKDASAEVDLNLLPLEERLEVLREFLQNEGFNISWEMQGESVHIKELNCPYYQVGQSHPEVCYVDRTVISSIMNGPATRVHCVLDGDNHCTYVVPVIPLSEIPVQ